MDMIKKISIFLAIIGLVLLAACSNEGVVGDGDGAVACTMDAKMCPDGIYVGRVGPNCEFEACPDDDGNACNYDNPEKNYVGKSSDECATIRFMCTADKEYFSDECGCGCKAKEPVENQAACKESECGHPMGMANTICDDGTTGGPACVRDTDGKCKWKIVECPNQDSEWISCAPEQRNIASCSAINEPVCAKVNVECIRAPCPPVEQTYSNLCEACANSRVDYYKEGACA